MASTIESKTLKQQFESLQKQQQEKLLRRKQKQEEKQKVRTKEPSMVSTDASAAFGIDDDLDLKLADPPSQGSIYSEELVNHLNDQIRELKDETGRLYKLLSERDLELRQLRKKQADKSATGGVTNETAATKIVELSKKVRELTADLEKERTKTRQSAKRCMDLENELQTLQENIPTTTGRKVVPPSAKTLRSEAGDMTESELKALQEKLRQAEAKVSEYRNQCQIQKKELAMAQKALEQEVGEGISLQQLLNSASSGGWRGRAQQIISLQKKVNELKSQVDSQTSRATDDLESEFMGSATRRNKMEERNREQLRKMEKERKENQERMASELKALEADHETLKSKLEASKARNKVLSNENKANKHQIQTLLEKGRHDDELIDALFKQQGQLKAAMETKDQKEKEVSQEKEQVMRSMKQKDQKEKNLIDQLSAIVAEKEAKVRSLEQEIEQLKIAHLQKAQISGISQMFEQHSRPSTASSYGNEKIQVDAMVVEDCGNLTPTPQERPESSHQSHQSALPEARAPSRPRTSSVQQPGAPSSQLNEEMQGLHLQCQEYKSLCQASTVERDRLTELVQVLQNRIQEATTKTSESQSEIIALRRKNVELEKRLGKAHIEKGQSAATKRTKSKVSLQSINFEEDPFSGEMAMEELQTQLEIQRDENNSLKAALQSTLVAKEEDLKLYSQMIEETKSIFLQGLRQYKQSTKGQG